MFRTLKPLILASGSPRRQQFLRDMGLAYTVVVPAMAEPRPLSGELPQAYAARTAAQKGREVSRMHPEQAVLAADTIVVADGRILGKPADAAESVAMLKRLAGRTHAVVTAVHLTLPGQDDVSFQDQTLVTFHDWEEPVLAAYAASGEPLDKAGGYAVQGLGSFLIASIEGSWTTVVGLPLNLLMACLLKHGLIALR